MQDDNRGIYISHSNLSNHSNSDGSQWFWRGIYYGQNIKTITLSGFVLNKNTDYIGCKVDNVLKSIGSRIRAERQYQKLTREELEELSGVSVDTIKRIEAGKTVKSDKLLRVILALDIPFDLLFPRVKESKEDVAKRIKYLVDNLAD